MRWFAVVVVAAAVACDGETTHEGTGDCGILAEACHEAGDLGNEEATACHDVGHGTDEAACTAQLDDCLAICEAVLNGTATTAQ